MCKLISYSQLRRWQGFHLAQSKVTSKPPKPPHSNLVFPNVDLLLQLEGEVFKNVCFSVTGISQGFEGHFVAGWQAGSDIFHPTDSYFRRPLVLAWLGDPKYRGYHRVASLGDQLIQTLGFWIYLLESWTSGLKYTWVLMSVTDSLSNFVET